LSQAGTFRRAPTIFIADDDSTAVPEEGPLGPGLELYLVGDGANLTTTASGNTITFTVTGGGSGTITGPGSSTDEAIVRWDGTDGTVIQNSTVTISDAGLLSATELNITTDLAVEYGGSGRSSSSAFAILCGGATATAAHQSVGGLGSSGQVLTSGGAASLPTWTTVSGSGDVTAAANLTDNSLIRGNGGAKGIQDSGILIDDSDNLSAVASIDISVGGDLQINSTSVLNATTLGNAVVASSLTSVGTISSGTWQSTDVGVAYGGTARSSHVAYSVICGGTTSTAAQQSVTSVGTSGHVLTSNGAGALPTFQAIASGDVTASAIMTDHSLIRGDGGAKGVQDSGILIDDSDNLSAVASIDISIGGDLQINGTPVLNATTLGAGVTASSLTSVGTISSGTWEGTTIAVDQGGSGQTSYTDGQLLIGNTTGNTLAKATLTGTSEQIDVANSSGSITLSLDTDFNTTARDGWFGSILESPVVTVTSDGATITCSVELGGGGDLTANFSDGFYAWDTSPADTVPLSAGTDTSPQINYVYLLQSNKTLTAAATWPAAEHAPIATVLCQSAASLQTDGAYKMHAWTDHVKSSDDMGHISHLNLWIRQQQATWVSGAATTYSDGAATFDVIIASGVVLQLHNHAYPAFNTSTGSDVYIVNDSATAYKKVGDLTGETSDSTGASMTGNWYSLVFWGVVNEATGDCKLMCNLPDGSYNNNNGNKAIDDDDGYNVFTIPSDFTGVGFLLARLTVSESGGTFTVQNNEDLRGQFPSTSAGGGATGGNEFVDNVFRIQDDGDTTKQIAFQASGITTATTRTITMANADIDLTPTTGSFGDVYKSGTPVDSQIGVWTADGIIEGDTDFTFDTSTDTLAVAASGKFAFGAVNILSDAAGTMTLSNVDALDATTTQTVEDAMIQLDNLTTAAALVTVGALNSGSITSGFGSIDNGASSITTTGVITGGTVEATTDTAAADNAAMGYTATEGLVLTGQGSVTDVTIKNDADTTVISIPTGATGVVFAGATDVSSGTVTGPSGTWDSGGMDIATTDTYAIAGTDVLNATTLGAAVVASSLTSVGTITTGVWQGTAIADEYGGTGQTTFAKGDILYASSANTLAKLPIGTDNYVLTVATDVPAWEAASGGGAMPEVVVGGLAASHQVNTTTAFAPVSYRDFGSIEMLVRSFDDTGPEYMQNTFRVPEDLGAGASSVTFEIVGSATTAASSKNVKFTFDFVEVADDGLLTGSYGSAEVWDDQSISATQNDQDIISNTETITNLAWTAGNMVYYRLYRSAATTTNLSGDYDVISFNIRIPRA